MKAARVTPDVTTYNTLISVCGQAGQWREAQALAEEMTTVGLTPDGVTHTSLLVSFHLAYLLLVFSPHGIKTEMPSVQCVACALSRSRFVQKLFDSRFVEKSRCKPHADVSWTSKCSRARHGRLTSVNK
eukprot:7250798-Pyramimonas_sp.AAC.3